MGLNLTLAAGIIATGLAFGMAQPSVAASTSGLSTLGVTTGDALSQTENVNLRCYKVCRGPYWRRHCETRCEPGRRRFFFR